MIGFALMAMIVYLSNAEERLVLSFSLRLVWCLEENSLCPNIKFTFAIAKHNCMIKSTWLVFPYFLRKYGNASHVRVRICGNASHILLMKSSCFSVRKYGNANHVSVANAGLILVRKSSYLFVRKCKIANHVFS